MFRMVLADTAIVLPLCVCLKWVELHDCNETGPPVATERCQRYNQRPATGSEPLLQRLPLGAGRSFCALLVRALLVTA